jgi:hypothetical protein
LRERVATAVISETVLGRVVYPDHDVDDDSLRACRALNDQLRRHL